MDILGPVRARLYKLYKRIDAVIVKYHRSYLVFACLFALTGYVLILIFPALIIISSSQLYQSLTENTMTDWQQISIWSVLLALATLLSYRSIITKPLQPAGLIINDKKLPKIFHLIQSFNQHFKRPIIQRVVITEQYELDIIKTPRWVLPFWTHNTLVIGLPVLLCLSPKQFECMLARRLGQFSKHHNRLTNWLYQLRAIWRQFYLSYKKQKYPDSKILQWLCASYAAIYDTVTVYAARKDELYADLYAMELFNHEDVREMITADMVYRDYLKNHFWPAVAKFAATQSKSPAAPYQKITPTIQAHLKTGKLNALVNKIFTSYPGWQDPNPSLQKRLENIGHDSPYMPEPQGASAATHYLGAALNTVIDIMNKLWQKNQMQNNKHNKTAK